MTNILTDEALLIAQAKAGEKEAFSKVVTHYEEHVIRIIARYVDDKHEALDLAQETFIKAYQALSSFRGESAFYTWLYRIAINTAKNYVFYKKRHPPHTDIDYEEAEQVNDRSVLKEFSTPEQIMLKEETEELIFDTLDSLPEELRIALILREMEGFSYDDIADVMNCPVGTVRSRIFRGREIIDSKLSEIRMK